jgi:hypothetical protein
MPPKGKRGLKFTVEEIKDLLALINDIVEIGNPEWKLVWSQHNAKYAERDHTLESLKRKFQELTPQKIPKGEPNCPPNVCSAKHIFCKILQATDGSTRGSNVRNDLLAMMMEKMMRMLVMNLVEMTWLLIRGWRTKITRWVLVMRIMGAL